MTAEEKKWPRVQAVDGGALGHVIVVDDGHEKTREYYVFLSCIKIWSTRLKNEKKK